MSNFKFSTNTLHAGHDPKANKGTRAVPIYATAAYCFENVQHAADLFGLAKPGYIYTRLNNPTLDILEQRLATLDGGIGATVFSSGTAAIFTGLLTILKSGDHLVSSSSLYGGTVTMFTARLPRLGIETTLVDSSDPENFKRAIKENTRALYLETIGNPKMDIPDIEKIAKIAHDAGLPLIVDNTVLTPALLRPIEYGADIVIYSLTKYMGGHGTVLGGAIVDAGKFNWANGNFPEFSEPNPSYHGLVYTDALGAAAFIAKTRVEGLRDYGACLSPFNAFEIIQGLETLPLRVKKHSENALTVAKWLSAHPKVSWVNYPGLESHESHKLAQKYAPEGQNGLFAFGLKSGYQGAKSLVDNVNLFSIIANLGDTKSMLIHPASTTHQQLTPEQLKAAGVGEDLIRISVGIEDVSDIIADLEHALAQVGVAPTNKISDK